MNIADSTRAHFSKAAKAGKLLRTAFARLLFNIVDTQTIGRLTSAILKVIQTDQVNDYGKKTANTGGLGMLEGFEFNKRKEVRKMFFASYGVDVDRTTGRCALTIFPFLPEATIKFPKGKSYCRLILAGGAFDFEAETYSTDIQSSEYFTQGKSLGLELRVQLPPENRMPIVLLLGIEFYRKVNDQYLLMYGGGPLALRVVHTDQQLPAAASN